MLKQGKSVRRKEQWEKLSCTDHSPHYLSHCSTQGGGEEVDELEMKK